MFIGTLPIKRARLTRQVKVQNKQTQNFPAKIIYIKTKFILSA